MITVDELINDLQVTTSDTTSQTLPYFVTWLNQGYQNLIATFGRPGIEKIINTTTNIPSNPFVDSDRSYQLPPDYQFLKTVKIQIGSRWYQLIEEESTEMWNYRTEYRYGGIPSEFYINENYGVASAEVQIDPIATTLTTTGSASTPTVAVLSGTNLNLTFTSVPASWATGTYVTLAGFVMASGLNVNNYYAISNIAGSVVTIPINDGTATDTVTTIGTVTLTSGVPMQIVYESSDVKLDHYGIAANPAYSFMTTTASNLTFTNNSNTVTSSASLFQGWMALGSSYITTGDDGDGSWYKIIQVNSGTQATIGNVYQGTTVTSGTNWSINQIMSLHVDMQDIPEYWALYKYYQYKKDAKWKNDYEQHYYQRLQAAQGNWATKSRSSIIRSKKGLSRWHAYPGYFPAKGASS